MSRPKQHLVLIMMLVTSFFVACQKRKVSGNSAEPARILAGEGAHGEFDPALTYDDTTAQVWMSYSTVKASSASGPRKTKTW